MLNVYPTYKDSGIEWLGQIPTHWEVRKIKNCLQERSEKGYPNEPILCATQSRGVIPHDMYDNRVVVVNKDFDKLKLVKCGDFVISLRSFQGGIEYAYYQGIISAAYTILTPKDKHNREYFKHLFKSHDFIQLLQTCVTGIREGQNINYDMLAKHFVPVPPEEEQRQIVAYLDYKSNKINERICQIERELQTLSELKQTEIAAVVTRGLDPNVPMKESGIEWLGKIPAHWNVKRIASVSHEINDSNVTMEYTQPSQFKFGEIVLKSIIGEGEYDENIKKCTLFKKNDILINGLNLNYDFVTQRVAKSNYDGIITPAYIVIRVKDGLSADYAMFLFKSIDNKKIFNGWGTGIRLTLSYKELKKQCIPIPPKEEQDAIVAYLQSRITFIDNYIAKLKEEINYLQEYKQRLISDVVTGKVDVRGVEIPNEE